MILYLIILLVLSGCGLVIVIKLKKVSGMITREVLKAPGFALVIVVMLLLVVVGYNRTLLLLIGRQRSQIMC